MYCDIVKFIDKASNAENSKSIMGFARVLHYKMTGFSRNFFQGRNDRVQKGPFILG
jgi:hypothetical protein